MRMKKKDIEDIEIVMKLIMKLSIEAHQLSENLIELETLIDDILEKNKQSTPKKK